MQNKALLLLIASTSLLSAHAQKMKIEKENIFEDKKEEMRYERPYPLMEADNTYAFHWKAGQIPFTGTVALNKKYGQLAKSYQTPDYIFEYISDFAEPKIDYIKTSEVLPSRKDLGYIARITYKSTFSVNILNKQKETLKTIIISNGTVPETYYFCLYSPELSGQAATPHTIEAKEVKDNNVKGWLTSELLALKITENQNNIRTYITTKILEDNFRKGRFEIHFLLSGGKCTPFQMYTIKEKAQKDFPELTAKLAELRSCFVKWARTPQDAENLQKLAAFANEFAQQGNEEEDRNTKLLYHMNAALAYTMCKDYEAAANFGYAGMQEERGFGQTGSTTVRYLYHTMKKLDAYKQAGKVIDATVLYDLENDFKKLR